MEHSLAPRQFIPSVEIRRGKVERARTVVNIFRSIFSCAYVNNQQGSGLGVFIDVGISVL